MSKYMEIESRLVAGNSWKKRKRAVTTDEFVFFFLEGVMKMLQNWLQLRDVQLCE